MPEQKDLVEVLTDLRSLIAKQTSYKFVFLRGILYGFGTVVGATILIGIVSWVLSTAFDRPTDVPLFGDIVEETQN